MINGIGVVGWGVGGIEAEAGMLGQPVYFLTPDVVGVELTGKLNEGVTATDLVLTVTEMLRKEKVVGKFVEFFGEGAASLVGARPRDDRQHGARVRRDDGLLPGRRRDRRLPRAPPAAPPTEIDAFEAYFKAQGLFGIPRAGEIDYTKVLTLDLASIKPSLAGPEAPAGPHRARRAEADVHRALQQAGRGERLRQAGGRARAALSDAMPGRRRRAIDDAAAAVAQRRSRATSSKWSTTGRRPITSPSRATHASTSATATC